MTNEKQAREQALEHFNDDRYHCAESVFLAVTEQLGYDPLPHLPMLTPFGGGIASTQTLCGVVSGGIMAIGLALGRTSPTGDRKVPESLTKDFIAHMEQMFNTTTCRTLTGVDFSDPAQREAFSKPTGPRADICCALVAEAAEYATGLIKSKTNQ